MGFQAVRSHAGGKKHLDLCKIIKQTSSLGSGSKGEQRSNKYATDPTVQCHDVSDFVIDKEAEIIWILNMIMSKSSFRSSDSGMWEEKRSTGSTGQHHISQ